ncbi:MAG: hypothetical protein M1820_010232 [Bogoriella megaspora]|nr:MAG: hypothetical protein M1820_010232 [Bogoriella megaspora]
MSIIAVLDLVKLSKVKMHGLARYCPQFPCGSDTVARPPRPRSVRYLLEHRSTCKTYTSGDTPLAALYRMYEFFLLADTVRLREEIEDFYERSKWPIHKIPDPMDADPERYAVLSVMTCMLMLAVNDKVRHGVPRGGLGVLYSQEQIQRYRRHAKFERQPTWALKVPPLKHVLQIPTAYGQVPKSLKNADHDFWMKNILCYTPHVYFI